MAQNPGSPVRPIGPVQQPGMGSPQIPYGNLCSELKTVPFVFATFEEIVNTIKVHVGEPYADRFVRHFLDVPGFNFDQPLPREKWLGYLFAMSDTELGLRPHVEVSSEF